MRTCVLALALLGLFTVSGISNFVAAQETAPVITVDETTKVESVAAPDAPTIAPAEVEMASETETEVVTPEVTPEVVEVIVTVPEVIETEVAAEVDVQTVTPVAPVSLLAISAEQGGASTASENQVVVPITPTTPTPAVISGTLAISDEQGGNTAANATGENNFTTGNTTAGENSFTTSTSTTPSTTPGENSFTTTSNTVGENSFTTLAPETGCTTNCGGGCTQNCGGGGGGGSSGYVGQVLGVSTAVPFACPLYLREYIRLGRNNNPVEVRKLQAFLNVFEGEHLAITGVYTQADFEAVERFQSQYLRDVLNPWGISETTGYVFITTRLAINNVYCYRSTQNDLDLRNYYGQIYGSTGASVESADLSSSVDFNNDLFAELTATSTATTTNETATRPNFFQAAAIGLLNLFNLNAGTVLISLLILAILFMLFLVWRLSRYPDTPAPESGDDKFYLTSTTDDETEADEIVVDESEVLATDLDDRDPVQPPLVADETLDKLE